MEKKFIELSLNETQAVVGGVKTVATMNQASVANTAMVRPDMNGAMVAQPSRPAISLPKLPKR